MVSIVRKSGLDASANGVRPAFQEGSAISSRFFGVISAGMDWV